MSHDKFIHHETISARDADEQHESGWFNVIEDEYGPYVFDCGSGMVRGRYETVTEAVQAAEGFAANWIKT